MGGLQASGGACADLAVRDLLTLKGKECELPPTCAVDSALPKQKVTFLAPIGTKNWTPARTDALNALLPMLQTPPILIESNNHVTPTINSWHDDNDMVNWIPVNGSFSEEGAGGLWKN